MIFFLFNDSYYKQFGRSEEISMDEMDGRERRIKKISSFVRFTVNKNNGSKLKFVSMRDPNIINLFPAYTVAI